LCFLLNQCLTTILQHQWASKLLGFDFVVEYKPGALNVVADALSCRDEHTAEAMAVSAPQFKLFDDLRHEINGDNALSSSVMLFGAVPRRHPGRSSMASSCSTVAST
jgi:hypothetical protein